MSAVELLDEIETQIEIPEDLHDKWKALRAKVLRSDKPKIECPSCGEAQEVSLEAPYQRDGVWFSAFQMNHALGICRNKNCRDWGKLRLYERDGRAEIA